MESLSPTAAEIAGRVSRGEQSAVELVRARLELVDRLNPRMNALVVPRADAALAEAAALDSARRSGHALGALAGVPISIKEPLDVEGMPSTAGVPGRSSERAAIDCAAVGALRRAGAIVLGKSNIAQALIFAESDNPVYGRCNHPEREDRSPGGSSGGEGALVAAGISTLGLGTDIGGSGRIPAAFCGVASMKPTAGRLPDPQRLSVPIGQLAVPSQLAAMARRVGDVELMLNVMNPAWCPLQRSASVHVSALRVGMYVTDRFFEPSPGVRRAVTEAADALRAAGATVVEFTLPDPEEANALFYGLLSADGMAGLKRLLRGGKRDPRVQQLLLLGSRSRLFRSSLASIAATLGQRHLPGLLRALGGANVDEYWQMCERQIDYKARFAKAMDRAAGGPLDLLLGPPVALPAFTHGAAKDLGVPGVYTTVYNLLGWPAGVVPVTRVRPGEESDRPASRDLTERAAARVEAGSAGLPLAVQIAARPWEEHKALAAMAAIERGCSYS